MAKLSSDSAVEAYASWCTESELRELYLNNLTESGRRRLATHGHIAISRALEFNKESTGVVQALLDQPEIQVNLPLVGQEENTTLHYAVLLQNKEAVRMLLARADLDPNVGNRIEDTPLHLAAQPGASLEILDLLNSDPRVNAATLNSDKQTPLHVACKLNNQGSPSKDSAQVAQVVRKLLNSAAAKVKSLPDFLQKTDMLGRNALHYAAENGLDAAVLELLWTQSSDGNNDQDLALVHDNKGCQAVHLATQKGHLKVVERLLPFGRGSCNDIGFSGRSDIAQECLKARCSLPKLCSVVHLYQGLLTLATHLHIAEFLLMTFYSSHIEDHESYPSLLHWAVKIKDSRGHGALLIPHILKWQPEKANEPLVDDKNERTALHVATIEDNHDAVEALCRAHGGWYLDGTQRDIFNNSALDYAFQTGKKPIRRILLEQSDVKEHLERTHKNRELYAVASNALLVVSVLVVTLTYAQCLTASEVEKQREDGSLLTSHFRLANTVLLSRIAFFMSMSSTILAAFAALPFSFGIFFVQTVDDHYVRRSLFRTRVLIVLASNFLMLSLGAMVFEFICSQYIAQYINYHCELACEIVLALFVVMSMVFLAPNVVRFWKARRAKGAKRARTASGRKVCPLVAV